MSKTTALDDFTVRDAIPMTAPRRMLTDADLLSMARAASRLAMKGKNYSRDDREDCAADIAARTLTTHAAPQCHCGGPAAYLTRPLTDDYGYRFRVVRCVRHWVPGCRRIRDAAYIPADDVTFTHLSNLAANYRRGLDRSRARDDRDANGRASDDLTTPGPDAALIRPAAPTPEAAHEKARELLTALGLPRLGKVYPAAYMAARVVIAREAERAMGTVEDRAGKTHAAPVGKSTGRAMLTVRDADAATCAAELGYTGKTPDKALLMATGRALKSIPALTGGTRELRVWEHDTGRETVRVVPRYGRDAFGSALGMEADAAPARKASATRTDAATPTHCKLRGMDAPAPDAAPVVLRQGTPRHDIAPPAWTRTLPPLTAARLKSAADMKRTRKVARAAAADAALTA